MPGFDASEPVRLSELKKGRIPMEIFELWVEVWDWTRHQIARQRSRASGIMKKVPTRCYE